MQGAHHTNFAMGILIPSYTTVYGKSCMSSGFLESFYFGCLLQITVKTGIFSVCITVQIQCYKVPDKWLIMQEKCIFKYIMIYGIQAFLIKVNKNYFVPLRKVEFLRNQIKTVKCAQELFIQTPQYNILSQYI